MLSNTSGLTLKTKIHKECCQICFMTPLTATCCPPKH